MNHLDQTVDQLGEKLNQIKLLMADIDSRIPADALFDQGRQRFKQISEMWREAKLLVEERVDDVAGKRAPRKLARMSRHDYEAILAYLSTIVSLDPPVPQEAAAAYRAVAETPFRLRSRAEMTQLEDVEQMQAALERFRALMQPNGDVSDDG